MSHLTCRIFVIFALLLGASSFAADAPGRLSGPVAELEPFLGTWEVRGRWSFGQDVWARASYVPGPGGKTVAGRVLVKDGDGTPYVRYASVFAYDAENEVWKAHTTHHDGKVAVGEFELKDNVMSTQWVEGGNTIRDRTEVTSDDKMRWLVEMTPEGTEDFKTLLDATWMRPTGKALVAPIDTNLFDPNPTSSFVVEHTYDVPRKAVFSAWTDPDDFHRFYAPDSKDMVTNIDLVIGGRYEILWDGLTGSNDCQVLSFIPDRMISFSWNAPPEQKNSRPQRTWVVVEFEDEGSHRTRVRLTHLGFGDEPHWQETKAYFAKAWPHVMKQFALNFPMVN